MTVMPGWLKEALDTELAQNAQLTPIQRKAVQAEAYTAAQRYIDTHKPGLYPAWGQHSKGVLARNVVRHAIQRVLYAQ
jgi:hypothetical protein